MAKEFTVPGPWPPRRHVLWRDNKRWFAVHLEVEPLEAKPERTLSRKLRHGSEHWIERQQLHLANVHDCTGLLALRFQCEFVIARTGEADTTHSPRKEYLKMARFFHYESEAFISCQHCHLA